MPAKPVLYGFSGSTYVRTVRILLADKGIDYDQVPVNVLAGETRQPEHLARHPFGKVPVLDIDGMRIRETAAICRYIEDTVGGPSLIPGKARDRARMNEAIGLYDHYGYPALVGVAGYHLFPDLIGGKNEDARKHSLEQSRTFLELVMAGRGGDRWLAGPAPSLADYFLAPLMFYVSLTPDAGEILSVSGMQSWWDAMNGLPVFIESAPDLG